MFDIKSKLPHVGTNIFTTMSGLANECGAINLAQGFPNFDTPPRLKELVNKYLQQGKNQYAPMRGVPELRQVIADKVENQYGRNINIDREICITSGASQAIFNAIIALVPRQSEVILIEPCYDSYRPAIELAGASAVSYVMEGPDFTINWSEFAKLVTDRTSMIIVNTPHNPTGSVFQHGDLEKLHEITKNTNIIVLSDEVYEHLVFDGARHHSLLSHKELSRRTMAVFSFGKTFHCTGWKIGYCIAPPFIMDEFVKTHQFDVFCVPHFLQCGIAEYMQDANSYLGLSAFYQKKRDLFASLMERTRFVSLPSKGSFFQLYEYSELSNEEDLAFAKSLTKSKLVASIPISSFYSVAPVKQYLRFCFAKNEETLVQAAEKLKF